ncbi:MAG: serine/threonine-protein kinase [Caldimonas sp.]
MAKINAARWAELSPRIDELLTLPALERSRWIDQLAVNDPATAGELREFMAVHESASEHAFLGGVADLALMPGKVVAGERLGAWQLVEPIGEGGMGAVWRARRCDGRFEGEAAIKLLHSGLFDAAMQERFRREGAILARLRHRGIAQLLDAGVSEQGQPYLVLELVRGERIDHWCNARALGVRRRVELFGQVLDAVAAAHGQLVIHRDLKPSNILVDEDGRVKLLDFGIARLLGDEAGPGLTREGAFALTPEYAAPEQFEGGVLGMGTDVYALGVVLFELLAGANPRAIRTGDGPLAHMRAALEGTDARASAVCPPDRRRALSGDLDNVLAKALRKEPAARYATAAAFADDLRAHLAHRPVTARPDALAYRLSKFVQRNRLGVALGAVAAAAAVLGVASTLWQAERTAEEAARARSEERRAVASADESARQRVIADQQRRVAEREAIRANEAASEAQSQRGIALAAADAAERERRRAGDEAERARAAAARAERERDRTMLELDFSDASGRLLYQLIGEAGDKPLTATEMMRRAVGFIDKQYGAAPEQRARLLSQVAYQLTEMGKHADARPLLDRAREIFVGRGDSGSLAVLDCQIALVNAYEKKPAELRATMDRAITVLLAQDDHTDSSVANCLTGRSHLRRLEGDLQGALADADRALAWFGQPRPGLRLSAMSARAARATALGMLGRWADGAADYRRLLAELQTSGEAETNRAAIYTSNLGSLLDEGGQTREAADAFRHAVDLRSRNGMEESANSLARLADLQARLGADDASALADRAIAASAKGGGPRLAGAVTMAGARAACEQGAWPRCATLLADAWKLLQPLLTPTATLRGDYEWLTTWLAVERGPAPAAVEALEARLAERAAASARGAVDIRSWLLVARSHRLAGRFDDAARALQRATALADKLRQGGYPANEFMGRCLLEQAQLEEALGHAMQARSAARDAATQLQTVLNAQAPATQSATRLAATGS